MTEAESDRIVPCFPIGNIASAIVVRIRLTGRLAAPVKGQKRQKAAGFGKNGRCGRPTIRSFERVVMHAYEYLWIIGVLTIGAPRGRAARGSPSCS